MASNLAPARPSPPPRSRLGRSRRMPGADTASESRPLWPGALLPPRGGAPVEPGVWSEIRRLLGLPEGKAPPGRSRGSAAEGGWLAVTGPDGRLWPAIPRALPAELQAYAPLLRRLEE